MNSQDIKIEAINRGINELDLLPLSPDLRSKNLTVNTSPKSRTLPYAFTEQGIYMLMTVLRSDLAVRQSKALIRIFKTMKDDIVENQDVLGSKALLQLATQTNQNTKDIAEIKDTMATKEDLKKVMDNFVDPDTYKFKVVKAKEKKDLENLEEPDDYFSEAEESEDFDESAEEAEKKDELL